MTPKAPSLNLDNQIDSLDIQFMVSSLKAPSGRGTVEVDYINIL
jgi:hypothetical protein